MNRYNIIEAIAEVTVWRSCQAALCCNNVSEIVHGTLRECLDVCLTPAPAVRVKMLQSGTDLLKTEHL